MTTKKEIAQETEQNEHSFVSLLTGTTTNRIWRAKYISRCCILYLITQLGVWIVWLIVYAIWVADDVVELLGHIIFCILFWCWFIIINNKRLHDWWYSWWIQLLFLVTLLLKPSILFLILICLCIIPWSKWNNKYGIPCKSKKREKILSVIVWALWIILIILGLKSYDWNPVSMEWLEHAQKEVLQVSPSGTVYWDSNSKKYHVDQECPAFSRSETVYEGTIADAYERWLTDPCRRCIPEYNEEDHEWHDHEHNEDVETNEENNEESENVLWDLLWWLLEE